jgi:hypothetical protein
MNDFIWFLKHLFLLYSVLENLGKIMLNRAAAEVAMQERNKINLHAPTEHEDH